jgi:hypothetical protein
MGGMDDAAGTPAQQAPTQGLPTTVVVAAVATAPPEPGQLPVFRCKDSDEPARIVLQQVDAMDFNLMEAFRYVGAAGTWTVEPADLQGTDLASIPPFLSWFVSRYGVHTLAALLHDHLCENGARLDPPVTRKQADDVFLTALGELKVPWLRSRLMWCAVSLATRWRGSLAGRLPMMLWIALSALGFGAVAYSLVLVQPMVLAAALVGPIPGSLLWGRHRKAAGLFAGYTLWLVALPALLDLVVYKVYAVAEVSVGRVRRMLPNADTSQPSKPPPYAAR